MELDVLKEEKFLQLILNSIPIYVFWKDKNSIFLGCNKNLATYAGLESPDEIIGKSDYDLPWSKKESDFFRKVDKSVMDSGEAQINIEEPITINDKTTRWIRTNKVPLFDDKNQVIGILGTYEDITSKKEMELKLIEQSKELKVKNENLQESNFKLEQVNIDLEQFAYAASHDLQEPLKNIGGFVDLLDKKYAPLLDEDGIQCLEYIKEGATRMSSFIQGILSYSRLEESIDGLEKVDFNNIISSCLKDLEKAVKDSNTQLKINLPLTEIECQSNRIGMLFYNLINNGIKFNKSATPIIKVDFQEKDNHWLFHVMDNGIGIKDVDSENIFKPFKRLNNRGKFPGNGIGLSICKRIVHIHGGEIWYSSNELGGTSFHFTIQKSI